MALISDSVGRGGKNARNDVIIIQQLLNNQRAWLNGLQPPPVTGALTPQTIEAIAAFQKNAVAFAKPPAIIGPNDITLRRLSQTVIARPSHKIFSPVCWGHASGSLTLADYAAAAQVLACDVAAIQAVGETETRSPWDKEGRPTILFERHLFSQNTNRMFDRTHPDISDPIAGGYGHYSAQYKKLERAALLNESAALLAASWGRFQILGANHLQAGFATVEAMVDAMMVSERRQLDATVNFISSNRGAKLALQTPDWNNFALRYNGPMALKHVDSEGLNYAQRIARKYAELRAGNSLH